LFLLLIALACVFPLSLYCLFLAMLHQRARPTMIRGAWDMAGVLIALSGFLLVGGTTIIFALHAAVRERWLYVGPIHDLTAFYSRAGRSAFSIWGGYSLVLLGGAVYLISSRRPCTVVYHITPAELEMLLIAAAERLGLPAQRQGARWLLGSPETRKGIIEVDGTAAMRCVALRWKYAAGTLRADVEAEVARDLAVYDAGPSPATTWFMTASASLFAIMVFLLGTFLIISR
jgi:hypothetical protein